MAIEWNNYPENFWHCYLKLYNAKKPTIINDLSLRQIREQIVDPWHQGCTFNMAGTIVRDPEQVEKIQIVQTSQPKSYYLEQYELEEKAQKFTGGFSAPPISELLPFDEGTNYTQQLLFSKSIYSSPEEDLILLLRICQRIGYSANILAKRSRQNKNPYTVEDEYDVQDLLQAVIRAYVNYSVQEDPIGKVAGTRSSRVDISIEHLGILIEVKYGRKAEDKQKIYDDFSRDLRLYSKWEPLKNLIYLVYNSDKLHDPETLKELEGTHEINGKRFQTHIILA